MSAPSDTKAKYEALMQQVIDLNYARLSGSEPADFDAQYAKLLKQTGAYADLMGWEQQLAASLAA